MAADAISERRDLLRDYAMRELTQPNKAQAFVNIVAKAVEINGGRNSEVVFSDLQAVLIGEGMTGDEGRNKGPHFAGGDYVLSGAAGFKPEFRYHDDGTIPIGRTFQHMLGKFPAGSYLGPREPCLSELPQMLLDAICDETCHVPTPEDLSTDSDSWAFDMQADAEARSFSMEDDADQRGSFSGTLPLESADNASDASQPGTADVDGDGTPDMSTPDDAGALPLPDDEEDAAARAPTRDGEDAAPATPSADATSPAGGSGQAGHPDDDATADLTSGLHKTRRSAARHRGRPSGWIRTPPREELWMAARSPRWSGGPRKLLRPGSGCCTGRMRRRGRQPATPHRLVSLSRSVTTRTMTRRRRGPFLLTCRIAPIP